MSFLVIEGLDYHFEVSVLYIVVKIDKRDILQLVYTPRTKIRVHSQLTRRKESQRREECELRKSILLLMLYLVIIVFG